MAPRLEQLSGGRALLRILSNLSDKRRAWASVRMPESAYGSESLSGKDVIQAIADANAFAMADPYRAATHNKGIMNGADAVALATGNDWRALEAGAHAYAARNGQYRALTDWHVESAGDAHAADPLESKDRSPGGDSLYGRLEMPMAVGIVGGATRSHPTAKLALKILGIEQARELAEVMAAVGLAQNLAALRALVTEGIQQGHMALHARQVAIAAGAKPEQVAAIAQMLIQEGQIREVRARELLSEID
jgi:hydroxymethylglutaryl-CoA reductase